MKTTNAVATSSASGGMGLGSILTVIFVIAKLVGIISWSWWWVFSPLWISLLMVIGVFVAVMIVLALIALIAAALD